MPCVWGQNGDGGRWAGARSGSRRMGDHVLDDTSYDSSWSNHQRATATQRPTRVSYGVSLLYRIEYRITSRNPGGGRSQWHVQCTYLVRVIANRGTCSGGGLCCAMSAAPSEGGEPCGRRIVFRALSRPYLRGHYDPPPFPSGSTIIDQPG